MLWGLRIIETLKVTRHSLMCPRDDLADRPDNNPKLSSQRGLQVEVDGLHSTTMVMGEDPIAQPCCMVKKGWVNHDKAVRGRVEGQDSRGVKRLKNT